MAPDGDHVLVYCRPLWREVDVSGINGPRELRWVDGPWAGR